jgi:hypothetical protein
MYVVSLNDLKPDALVRYMRGSNLCGFWQAEPGVFLVGVLKQTRLYPRFERIIVICDAGVTTQQFRVLLDLCLGDGAQVSGCGPMNLVVGPLYYRAPVMLHEPLRTSPFGLSSHFGGPGRPGMLLIGSPKTCADTNGLGTFQHMICKARELAPPSLLVLPSYEKGYFLRRKDATYVMVTINGCRYVMVFYDRRRRIGWSDVQLMVDAWHTLFFQRRGVLVPTPQREVYGVFTSAVNFYTKYLHVCDARVAAEGLVALKSSGPPSPTATGCKA